MGAVRPGAQQKPDTVGAAGLAGQVEGGAAPGSLGVHWGPGIKQNLHTATVQDRGWTSRNAREQGTHTRTRTHTAFELAFIVSSQAFSYLHFNQTDSLTLTIEPGSLVSL